MFYRYQRFLAGLLSVALLATSSHIVEAASSKTPDPLERFAPARGNGYIADRYRGADPRTVILIQDLHLHYPTQQRIVKILNHLYASGLASGPLAIEGIEGPYDTSKIASYPEGKIKSELVDYFMKKGELSAPEAFSVLRGDGHLLYGVDKAQYYDINRNLFKASRQDRNALRAQLVRIQSGLALLKHKNYPRALRRLDKEEAYGVAAAEKLLNQKLALCPNDMTRNLVTADHMLRLTERLVRQEVTLDETRYIAQRLPAFVSVTKDLLKTDATAVALEDVLKSAVDFYVVALMRDGPLAEHTLALLKNTSVVPLVAGGFHTKGLTTAFKQAGVSYVVISPEVSEIPDAAYHDLYEKRLSGDRITWNEVAADLHMPSQKMETSPSLGFEENMVAALSSLPGREEDGGDHIFSESAESIRTANGGRAIGTLTRLGLSLRGRPASIRRSLEPSDPNLAVTKVLADSVDRYGNTGRKITGRGKTQFYLVDTKDHPDAAHAYRKRHFFTSRIVLDQAEILKLTELILTATHDEKESAKTLLDLYVHHEMSHSTRFTGVQLDRAAKVIGGMGFALMIGVILVAFLMTVPWALLVGPAIMIVAGFVLGFRSDKRKIEDENEERNIVLWDVHTVRGFRSDDRRWGTMKDFLVKYRSNLKGIASYFDALYDAVIDANAVDGIVKHAMVSLEDGIRTSPPMFEEQDSPASALQGAGKVKDPYVISLDQLDGVLSRLLGSMTGLGVRVHTDRWHVAWSDDATLMIGREKLLSSRDQDEVRNAFDHSTRAVEWVYGLERIREHIRNHAAQMGSHHFKLRVWGTVLHHGIGNNGLSLHYVAIQVVPDTNIPAIAKTPAAAPDKPNSMTTDETREGTRTWLRSKGILVPSDALLEVLSRVRAPFAKNEWLRKIIDPVGFIFAKGHNPFFAGVGLVANYLLTFAGAALAYQQFSGDPAAGIIAAAAALVLGFFGWHLAINLSTLPFYAMNQAKQVQAEGSSADAVKLAFSGLAGATITALLAISMKSNPSIESAGLAIAFGLIAAIIVWFQLRRQTLAQAWEVAGGIAPTLKQMGNIKAMLDQLQDKYNPGSLLNIFSQGDPEVARSVGKVSPLLMKMGA